VILKYNKKKRFLFYLSVLILIIFLINLLILLPGVKRNLEQDFRILTLQPILLKSGNTSVKETIKGIFDTFKEIHKINRNYPLLKINVDFQNLSKIINDKNNALKKSILFNPQKVSAKIIFNNKEYDARIRLKGDLEMHWSWSKQFSLRIELQEGETIMGMREFSITQHQARNFPYTELVSESLKLLSLNLIADYKTFKVILNGENWGIMLAEEQYSGPYLERRRYIDSPVIKLTNEENWKFFKQIEEVNNNKLDKEFNLNNAKNISKFQGVFEVNTFNRKKNSSLRRFYRISKFKNLNEKLYYNEINYQNIGKYLNLEQLAKVIASSFVFGDSHSLNSNNMRFYINPFTAKLDLIPTDHSYMFGNYKNFIEDFKIDLYKIAYFYMPKIIKLGIQNEDFQYFYSRELFNLDNNFSKFNKKVDEICKVGLTICRKQIDLKKVKRNLEKMKSYDKNIFKLIIKDDQNIISNNEDLDNFNEDLDRYLKYMRNHIHIRSFDSGIKHIKNLSPFNVTLTKMLTSNDQNCFEIRNKSVSINENCKYNELIINQDIDGSFYPKLSQVKFEFFKLEEGDNFVVEYKINEEKFYYYGIVENKVFDKLDREDIFFKTEYTDIIHDKKLIKIKAGNWNILNPLILPVGYTLVVDPGTTLNFSKDTYIRVENGSINLLGEKNNPIIMTSDYNWNGILVLDSNKIGKESIIQNTIFQNLNEYKDKERHITGSINFYKSDVLITDSQFKTNISEDFINIIYSKFKIFNSEFINVNSDAIDIDFGSGTIKNSSFKLVNGDGFDTSGSETSIENNYFEEIFDKAISIGENSKTNIIENKILNSNIGIAIKDGSKAKIEKNEIYKSGLADIMSYNKKTFFDKSVTDIFSDNQNLKIIIQEGNLAYINNKKINSEIINVKQLYN